MKIALVVDQPQFTGIGKYARSLLSGLKAQGVSVKLVSVAFGDESREFDQYISNREKPPFSIPIPAIIKKRNEFLQESGLLDSFDIIHLLGSNYALSRRYDNLVCTIHELYFTFPRSLLDANWKTALADAYFNYSVLRLRRQMKQLHEIVVPSNHVAQDILAKCGIETNVIHHWIDRKNFRVREKSEALQRLNLDPNYKYILNVSHGGANKNQSTLMKIADLLPHAFKIVHIGNNLRHGNILNFNSIPRNSYPLFFNSSDIYLHTSTNEGFGWPILESMASGLPVIANTLATSREILGDTGIYVADAWSAKSYACKIRELLQSGTLDVLKSKLILRASLFSESFAMKKYLQVYNDLLARDVVKN